VHAVTCVQSTGLSTSERGSWADRRRQPLSPVGERLTPATMRAQKRFSLAPCEGEGWGEGGVCTMGSLRIGRKHLAQALRWLPVLRFALTPSSPLLRNLRATDRATRLAATRCETVLGVWRAGWHQPARQTPTQGLGPRLSGT